MTKRTLEETVMFLEGEVGMLKECIEMLASNCPCTVRERASGHHVDCAMPHVHALLQGDPGEDKPYRDPTE